MTVAYQTYDAILKKDAAQLSQALALNQRDAKSEIQLLLSVAENVSRAYVAAYPECVLEGGGFARYRKLLQRRVSGEPVAYILGRKEFYGMDFSVNLSVLIPRPETELLVEHALERLPDNLVCRVLDLGTGSGIIAITLAKLRPRINVTAVEYSRAALGVAMENAENLGANNTCFVSSNWYDALGHQVYDVIVSNPPYIASDDSHLRCGDLRFEPTEALSGGVDGLASIREITMNAHRYLCSGGWLLFEHGYDQAQATRAELRAAGFGRICTYLDLAGIPRVTEGQLVMDKPANG